MSFKFISIIAVIWLQIGCTERGQPIVEHEDPAYSVRQTEPQDSSAILPTEDSKNWSGLVATSNDPMTKVILPLAKTVLHLSRVGSLELQESRAVLDELITLNNLVIQTNPAQRASLAFRQVMGLYLSALKFECEQFQATCKGLNYLQRAGNSSVVLRIISELNPTIRFQALLYSVKLKNSNPDFELLRALFKAIPSELSKPEQSAHIALRSFAATTIQVAANTVQDTQQVHELLDAINAWEQLSNRSNPLEPATLAAIADMVARSNYLYSSDGSLKPELKQFVLNSSKSPSSLVMQQHKIKGLAQMNEGPNGVQPLDAHNEIIFFIEQFESGHLGVPAAAALIGQTKRSSAAILSIFLNYYRLKFLVTVHTSLPLIKDVFAVPYQGRALVNHVVSQSKSLQASWINFKTQGQKLKSIFELAVQKRRDAARYVRQFDVLIGSTDHSITMSVTFPLMIALFQRAYDARETIRLPNFTQVPFEKLMPQLLGGHIASFIPLVDGKILLTSPEVLHTFDMGLRNEIFSTLNLDIDQFIHNSMTQTTGEHVAYIDSTMGKIRSRFAEVQAFRQFLDVCKEFTDGQLMPRQFYLADLVGGAFYYGRSLDRKFNDSIFTIGSESGKRPGDLPTSSLGIRYIDGAYTEAIERARLDLGTGIRLGQALLSSYRSHLQSSGKTSAEVTQLTKKSQAYISSLQAKQKSVLAESKEWFDSHGKCHWQISARQVEVQVAIFEAEKSYFRYIHQLMTNLRQTPVTPEALASVQGKISFHNLPSDFRGTDEISANRYKLTRIDALIRIAGYLSGRHHNAFGPNVKAIAPQHVRVSMGNELTLETEVVRDSHETEISYHADADTFVWSAIKALTNPGNYGLQSSNKVALLPTDFEYSARVNFWRHYSAMLIQLNRLEAEFTTQKTRSFPQLLLWQEQEAILKSLAYHPEEIERFQRTNTLSRSSSSSAFDKALGPIQAPWGLFDMPLQLATEPELGDNLLIRDVGMTPPPSSRQTYLEIGLKYYRARAEGVRKPLIVPYNSEMDKELDRTIGKFVRTELKSIADFVSDGQAYTDEIKLRPKSDQPYADLDVNNRITGPFLSEHILTTYQHKLRSFHRATNNCFTSDTSCF